MNFITPERSQNVLDHARGKRVAVVGDYMLDRHLKGAVRRISPEAPVPVVEVESEVTLLGGAGNVIQNLASLELRPVALGAVGEDGAGRLLLEHLERIGTDVNGMISCVSRPTTEKTSESLRTPRTRRWWLP